VGLLTSTQFCETVSQVETSRRVSSAVNVADWPAADPNYGLPTQQYVPPGATDGSPQPLQAAGGAPGGNPLLYEIVATVTATITNTGPVAGDEVAQLYVYLGDGEPPKVLRGFDRITIAAGQSATFTAELTRRDVSTWDTVSQNWVEVNSPTIYVGSSSRNLPLSGTFSSGGSSGGSPPSPPPTGPSSYSSAPPAGSPSSSYGAPPTASSSQVVSQYSDGQPQWGAPTGYPVSQHSDGQPAAWPTSA